MFESQHSFNEDDEEAKQDEFLLLGGYQLLRLVASDGFLEEIFTDILFYRCSDTTRREIAEIATTCWNFCDG